MASIERTAYPRFKRSPTPQHLHALYTPTDDELIFAQKTARSPTSQLGLLVLLKSFQQLGYFPKLSEVPAAVVDHLRSCLSLISAIEPGYEDPRTLYRHHQIIRDYLRVTSWHSSASRLAIKAMSEAAEAMDNPAPKSPTLKHLREWIAQLDWLESHGRIDHLLAGLPPLKLKHFAAEARALDATEVRNFAPPKRYTLLLCLIHRARVQCRDQLALMLIKRMAKIRQRAKDELEELRVHYREKTASLVSLLAEVVTASEQSVSDEEAGQIIRALQQTWKFHPLILKYFGKWARKNPFVSSWKVRSLDQSHAPTLPQ